MLLDKKDLFYNSPSIKMKLYVGDNIENENIILNILEKYFSFLNKSNTKQLLGLDFEFNTGTIALAQLNLDKFKIDNNEIILLFDPTNEKFINIFRQIVLHDNIWVILHGAESLDLPYMTRQLLQNKKQIVKLFSNLIDTKFLCEYSLIDKKEGRCKINYFLQQENIISKKFLEDMLFNEEKMGPIYLVHVDVKKLSKELMLYSAYDVIFLPELIRKIKVKYPFIQITRILQINYLMKFKLFKKYDETKELITTINNSYYPKLPTHNNRLIDIIPPLIEMSQSEELEKLKKIPGFKKIIDIIEKSYLYPLFINKTNFVLLNPKGKNLQPLDLPKEIKPIFEELQSNIKSLLN